MWVHELARARSAAALAAAIAVAIAVIAAAPAVHARAGPCTPVRVASDVATLSREWRAALDALVRATSQEGQPWSCPEGSVELVADASGGAVLKVIDAKARTVSRRVPRPDELLATGEALLAAPLEERAPLAPAPTDDSRDAKTSGFPADPRMRVDALVGPRMSGPGMIGWMSSELRVALPFGPWSFAFWGRYDARVAGPHDPPENFHTSSVSAGLSGGRTIVTSGRFELSATFDPSIGVVLMESGFDDNPRHPDGARLAFRLGTSLCAAFQIASVFRAIASIDGEIAPTATKGLRRIDMDLPAVPIYTAGLLLGVEATIR